MSRPFYIKEEPQLARQNVAAASSPGSELRSVAELREWFKKTVEQMSSLRLIDPKRNTTRRYGKITIEKLRQYFQNPYRYQTELIKAAQYFYRTNAVFQALVQYFATMFVPDARSVIPRYPLAKRTAGSDSKVVKAYYQTLDEIEKLDLLANFTKMLIDAWTCDVAYGVLYRDDTGAFILPLDPEYCRISGMNADGTFTFAYNMDYFIGSNAYLLDYWGEPFVSMYKNRGDLKWVNVPSEVGVVIKINTNDPLLIMPPFAGLFSSLIQLSNLEDIQDTKDALSAYKILVAKVPLLGDSKLPDDFAVDIETAEAYCKKIEANLMEQIGFVMSPGLDLDILDVMEDGTSEVNRINQAQSNIFDKEGVPLLDAKNITSSTAWKLVSIYNTRRALSTTLPQIQAFVNRWLQYKVGANAAKVVFHLTSPYLLDTFREQVKDSATLGMPVKLLLNQLNGISEMDTLRMNRLEIEELGLHEAFIPLSSSYTQSSEAADPVKGGAPTKTEVTDKGDESRDNKEEI